MNSSHIETKRFEIESDFTINHHMGSKSVAEHMRHPKNRKHRIFHPL